MPVYLSEGSTRPYFKETSSVVIKDYGHGPFHKKQVDLFPVSGVTKSFYSVETVTIGTAPLKHVGEGTGETAYILRRGSYCEIVRGGDGTEHLQCQRGKWRVGKKLPKKYR